MSNSAAFKTVIETLVVSGRTSGLHSASNNSSQQVFVLVAVRHLGLRNRPLFILSSRELFEFVDLSSLDYFVLKSQCGQDKTIYDTKAERELLTDYYIIFCRILHPF